MKRIWLLVIVSLASMLVSGCTPHRPVKPVSQKQAAALIPATHYSTKTQQEKDLAGFVSAQLLTSRGIYSQNQVGHRPNVYLSESAGLWLTYLAGTGQTRAYRQFYRQTLRTFNHQGVLMYQVKTPSQQRATMNATLDDLRVIRSLSLYATKTNHHAYQVKATRRFNQLWQNVGQGDFLRDFYDFKHHQIATVSSLAYYDLLTLKVFEDSQASGRQRYQRQVKLVQEGFLNTNFPLYAANYDWQQHRYSTKSLNTSEALLTLLHLAEIHQLRPDSLDWLRQRVNAAKLYNGYNVHGTVTDWGQSAANYAIAARIFAALKQRDGYNQAMNQVWRFQINAPSTKLGGALGDAKQGVSYAFNDLQALVASLY